MCLRRARPSWADYRQRRDNLVQAALGRFQEYSGDMIIHTGLFGSLFVLGRGPGCHGKNRPQGIHIAVIDGFSTDGPGALPSESSQHRIQHYGRVYRPDHKSV